MNDALRDRLVCGLHNESIQKNLLAIKDLTLKDAQDKALGMEAADNTKALHGTDSAAVHKLLKQHTQNATSVPKYRLAHKYFTSRMALILQWVNLVYAGPPVLRVTFMYKGSILCTTDPYTIMVNLM